MHRWLRTRWLLLAPIMLASCVLTPGRFTSTLRIDADRHFAFTYVGEVYALDPEQLGNAFDKGAAAGKKGDAADRLDKAAPDKPDAAAKQAQADAKNRAIAAALSKEAGYRRVVYDGNNRFEIDYAMNGTLDRPFVFPYNLDAEAIFPFVVVELRQDGTARVKAPGFANDNSRGTMPGADGANRLDGSFTLDTNAEIVSQNNEDGAKAVPGGRRTVVWKVTPLSKDAPTAVLKLSR